MLFDADSEEGKKITPQSVAPESEQEPNESRRSVLIISKLEKYISEDESLMCSPPRLWKALTDAINDKNMETATEAKSAVEDAQRELRRVREQKGETYIPRFFEQRNGRWVPKFKYARLLVP